jgi:hypothetical protein
MGGFSRWVHEIPKEAQCINVPAQVTTESFKLISQAQRADVDGKNKSKLFFAF